MADVGSLIDTQDGSHSMMSSRFGVSYHSKYGAIQESRHVFIKSGLGIVLPQKENIRIFEMGFGTGLNAYLTWLINQAGDKHFHYETVESHPLTIDQAKALNYPNILEEKGDNFLELHQCDWNKKVSLSPTFDFIKWQMPVQEAPLTGNFDLVFFDAFAPSSQPELWETPVLGKLYDMMSSGGVFVTYCAKGVVKRCLKSLGFTVEGIPGPPGKREMTRAIKP